jgi:glycosyltransferase involved in cell wall biosynthesis
VKHEASVSVVIPVYNGERFVAEAIESVYAQTVAVAELVVVNDGSTDGTERLLQALAPELPDSFSWETTANSGGPARPRNRAIERTTGDYIAFLDQDDLWYPTKLERQLQSISNAPDIALSFTGYRFVEPDASRVVIQSDWDPDPAVVLNRLLVSPAAVGPPSTVLLRRAALQSLPKFDDRVGYCDDWSMWLHMAAAGMEMDYVSEVLVDYRWHGENLSLGRANQLSSATRMFDVLFSEPDLPQSLRRRARRCRAYWYLEAAIDAIQAGDTARARRNVMTAARIRPLSVRPGWVRMLGLGSPPRSLA